MLFLLCGGSVTLRRPPSDISVGTLGADLAGVETKIGVRRIGGHAKLGVSGVLVHGLRADQHEGVTMLRQGLQGVQQHPPRRDVELVLVYPWRWLGH
jgi:hypothetical protein